MKNLHSSSWMVWISAPSGRSRNTFFFMAANCPAGLGSARPHVDLLVQHCDLILDAVLFALQSLLGDAFDGHQPLSPLLLSQVDLREGPTATQKHTFRTPAAASELFVAGSHLCIRYMCRT